MNKKPMLIIVALAALFILGQQCLFVVDQTERAIVLQLGRPLDGVREPGLHFKLPFVQNAVLFDIRVLDYDTKPSEVITRDKKTMVVDNYVKWRIVEPLQFYRTVRTIPRAEARMDDIVYSEMREALGRFSLIEIVAMNRAEIMQQVTASSKLLLEELGVEILDVRIKGTDLPAENERAIFGRMRAEREREAKQYRSEGMEEAAKIKAATDRERSIILAEAERQGEILRGEGDADATRIYAETLSRNPDFYEFNRSLEAYRQSMKSNARIILTPESPFLKYMR
ncbi:HflC protein [Alkalidesulfovibrio alkalitolerans DSM 16529]|uniref:Protein HflC n=1 Tax=Alkalidesulfovibrio alkalitolerans DSM 16529 TaxID=1121439 RepID=S7US72_9BACT|nr:protease modulator HflC [Alkalidesulfovibrio alkalitolerans]EPR35148.1 HflC protein [Alkalidesulfovibrio alkalitolerans DSM 16529]